MYACGFSVPQMWQFCLFTYQPRSKSASSEKIIFFLSKSAFSVRRTQAHLVKCCSNIYTTKIARRKDKTNYLSNQRWAKLKKTLDGGPNMYVEDNERPEHQWTCAALKNFKKKKMYVEENERPEHQRISEKNPWGLLATRRGSYTLLWFIRSTGLENII